MRKQWGRQMKTPTPEIFLRGPLEKIPGPGTKKSGPLMKKSGPLMKKSGPFFFISGPLFQLYRPDRVMGCRLRVFIHVHEYACGLCKEKVVSICLISRFNLSHQSFQFVSSDLFSLWRRWDRCKHREGVASDESDTKEQGVSA